jgi:hypothetical protein
MSETIAKIPNLDLAQYKFILASGPKDLHASTKAKLIDAIKENRMFLVREFGIGIPANQSPNLSGHPTTRLHYAFLQPKTTLAK